MASRCGRQRRQRPPPPPAHSRCPSGGAARRPSSRLPGGCPLDAALRRASEVAAFARIVACAAPTLAGIAAAEAGRGAGNGDAGGGEDLQSACAMWGVQYERAPLSSSACKFMPERGVGGREGVEKRGGVGEAEKARLKTSL